MAQETEQAALAARERYVRAFNDTMIKIWREQIALLKVVDTGRLYNSVVAVGLHADGRFAEITLSQRFRQYGIYVDAGVGKDTPKGGGTGGTSRRRRRWFSKKYYASMMNLSEFMAESLGHEFCGLVADALRIGNIR